MEVPIVLERQRVAELAEARAEATVVGQAEVHDVLLHCRGLHLLQGHVQPPVQARLGGAVVLRVLGHQQVQVPQIHVHLLHGVATHAPAAALPPLAPLGEGLLLADDHAAAAAVPGVDLVHPPVRHGVVPVSHRVQALHQVQRRAPPPRRAEPPGAVRVVRGLVVQDLVALDEVAKGERALRLGLAVHLVEHPQQELLGHVQPQLLHDVHELGLLQGAVAVAVEAAEQVAELVTSEHLEVACLASLLGARMLAAVERQRTRHLVPRLSLLAAVHE